MRKLLYSFLYILVIGVFVGKFFEIIFYFTSGVKYSGLINGIAFVLVIVGLDFFLERNLHELSSAGKKSRLIVFITFLAMMVPLHFVEELLPDHRISMLYFVIGGILILLVGSFFVHREEPFKFSRDESPRDDNFELNLWNQLILVGRGKSDKVVLNKEIDNREGLTLADIALVKAELRKWDTDKLQEVLDFIGLPMDHTVFSLSVKNLGPLRNLLPKKLIAPLLAAVSAYTVFQNYINSFLTEFLTKIQTSLTSFDLLVVLDVVVVLAYVFLVALILFPFFSSLSGDTKRKQVKQILPKLLKEVLEEKQSQVNRSRQFPKRWTK